VLVAKPEREMIVRNRNILLGTYLSLTILWASSVYADNTLQKGATEWGINGGYGHNFHIHGNVKEDIQFYFLTPFWGKVLKKWEGGGSLAFIAEGFLSHAEQDSKGRHAVGITPLFAYYFKALGKVALFLEVGAGILYTNLDPEHFGSTFDFTPQGGIGIRYYMANGRFLNLSYRFHHISNANIDSDNRSIDSHFFSIGISFLSMTKGLFDSSKSDGLP
jgi:hypothetical protein